MLTIIYSIMAGVNAPNGTGQRRQAAPLEATNFDCCVGIELACATEYDALEAGDLNLPASMCKDE
jgi:hypothetical protein